MKPLFLSIFLLVGITASVFSQGFVPNPDGSFWVSGIVKSPYGLWTTEWPTELQATEFNGKYINDSSRVPSALLASEAMTNWINTNRPIYVMENNTNVICYKNLSGAWVIHLYGAPTADSTSSDSDTEFPWEATGWYDEGLDGSGISFSSSDPSAQNGNFVQQAQELNVGLEFNGGNWTVKE
jgi:hypothetical protein